LVIAAHSRRRHTSHRRMKARTRRPFSRRRGGARKRNSWGACRNPSRPGCNASSNPLRGLTNVSAAVAEFRAITTRIERAWLARQSILFRLGHVRQSLSVTISPQFVPERLHFASFGLGLGMNHAQMSLSCQGSDFRTELGGQGGCLSEF
jgi:hypothetical protein